MSRFLFPRWSNALLPFVLVVGAVAPLYMTLLVAYGFSPKTLDGQYQPVQPVPYSHALHAGKLGLDCRYCHASVETSAVANIPPTAACMNCHMVKGKGSAIGPALDGLATRATAAYIHDSLVEPNKVLAKGYEQLGVSPMPPMGLILKPQELADLRAFLQTLK